MVISEGAEHSPHERRHDEEVAEITHSGTNILSIVLAVAAVGVLAVALPMDYGSSLISSDDFLGVRHLYENWQLVHKPKDAQAVV